MIKTGFICYLNFALVRGFHIRINFQARFRYSSSDWDHGPGMR